MNVFVVTAYRFGEVNNHSYVVCVCPSIEQAKQAAEKESDWRGGKYACEVTKHPLKEWDNETKIKSCYYSKSLFCSKDQTHPIHFEESQVTDT